MSQGLFFLVTLGLLFSPLGVGKQGIGMEHPVPLQEAGAAESLRGFWQSPHLCPTSFLPSSPCAGTQRVNERGKLLGSVPVSIPGGCTWLQPLKSLPAPGWGAQYPGRGDLGWGGSRATPLTVLALLCPHRKRRGAINSKQLTYLEKYRPKQRLRFKDPHNHKNKCCIM